VFGKDAVDREKLRGITNWLLLCCTDGNKSGGQMKRETIAGMDGNDE
jgi:hypothetical protein